MAFQGIGCRYILVLLKDPLAVFIKCWLLECSRVMNTYCMSEVYLQPQSHMKN